MKEKKTGNYIKPRNGSSIIQSQWVQSLILGPYIIHLSLEPTQVESVEVLSSFYYIVWLAAGKSLFSIWKYLRKTVIAHIIIQNEWHTVYTAVVCHCWSNSISRHIFCGVKEFQLKTSFSNLGFTKYTIHKLYTYL